MSSLPRITGPHIFYLVAPAVTPTLNIGIPANTKTFTPIHAKSKRGKFKRKGR